MMRWAWVGLYNPAMRPTQLHPFSWDRMARAVQKVRDRLMRATGALECAGVPYAVADGNAVAAWVARVDESAVRNTRDVDILLRRADLERARAALESAGFVYRHVKGIDMFLDGRVPGAKARDAVHVVFADEKVREGDSAATPDVTEAERAESFNMVALEALVRMKLLAYRRKDQVHLLDMLDVGLIDASWVARFDSPLNERLQHLIDTPEG